MSGLSRAFTPYWFLKVRTNREGDTMKTLSIILIQFITSLAMANVEVVTCKHNENHKTGNPDFVQDITVEIKGSIHCKKPLPTADMSYTQAEALIANNICTSEVASQGEHTSFVTGFDEIISSHDVIASAVDGLQIQPQQRCIATDCGSQGSGCWCVKTEDAPELGFIIKGSGLFLRTNKTEDLSKRTYESTKVSMTNVEIIDGNETKTVNGQSVYNGKPLRTRLSAVNWDIGEETKNLSYDLRDLNFKQNECSL